MTVPADTPSSRQAVVGAASAAAAPPPPAARADAPRPSLFRPAAMQGSSTSHLGEILLARPVGAAVLTVAGALCAIAVVTFLACFSYTRKAHLAGMLVPAHGVIRLAAGQAGIVTESRVHDGQPVKKGDLLFVVSSERATSGRHSTQAAVASLLHARQASLESEATQQRVQARERAEAARRRAEQLLRDIARIDAQSELQARRVALARAALQRYAELQAARFVSGVQVHDKQADLLDQEQRLAELQRARGAAERERAAVDAQRRDQDAQAARERLRLERDRAAVEHELVENEARHETAVRAPQDGTVAAVSAEAGQAVGPTHALAFLLPADSPLEAELYAPAQSVGFLRPGMDVVMRYRAYAYQKFGQARGRVREVSGTAVRADDMPLPHVAAASGASNEPLYRVRVQLEKQAVTTYGMEQRLRSGASVDASVLLETRRLIEWVLEPLYSITGRL